MPESGVADMDMIQTGRQEQIRDLDTLPRWDRSLVDYRKYHQFVGQSGIRYEMTMQATRGCPYRCFYCDVQHLTPMHRRRSVESVFDEVKYLHDIGVRKSEFIEDAFNVNINEFKAFFRKVIDAKMDMSFYFQSGLRGDLLDKEAIDLMVEGGTKSMNLSLESASPRLQKLMGKYLQIDRLRDNLDYIVRNYPQIIIGLNAMHGFPTETEEEAQATVDFIMQIKWLHFAQLHNVRIFPNSRLEQVALDNGVTKQEIEESLILPYHIIPPTIKLNHDFSRRLRLTFVHKYILNPERLRYVLQQQLAVMNEEELIYKYRTIFPTHIDTLDDILRLARLKREAIDISKMPKAEIPQIDYPRRTEIQAQDACRILFVDASYFFSADRESEIQAVEPPLGCMAILSYLNERYGARIYGEIIKTGVDVDTMEELRAYATAFKPDLLMLRTLTYYKDFFVDVIAELKKIFPDVPIVAGGPHPTIDPEDCLYRGGVNVCVIGEGELVCGELVGSMLRDGRFPDTEELQQVKGIVFFAQKQEKDAPEMRSVQYSRYPLWTSSDFDEEKGKLSE